MNKKFEAVLFDMDGLMVDTERLSLQCWMDTCRNFGYEFPQSLYLESIGRTEKSIKTMYINEMGSSFPLEQIWQECKVAYIVAIRDCEALAKPGLLELMDYLEAGSVSFGVGSSSGKEKIEYKLRIAGVYERLDAIVSGDDVAQSKPDPETYLRLAEKLGADPRNCLVLEDSYNGIRSAQASGATTIMVPDLLPFTPEMERLSDKILDTLNDVLAWLKTG